jgi:RNA polymerase sigma factor (sigma-70 family)
MSKAPLNELVQNLRRTVEAYRLDALPDAELLERFRRTTDPAAFEAIVRRHGDRVLAACHKVLSDPADVEDAFQATFLVLLREARAVRKRESLGGWLYGVAHRTALQARLRAARRADVEARKPTRTSEEAPDLSWQEACAILHEELDRLPDTYRLPLLLCYLEGKSRDEAAQQLGVNADVVRGRLDRGRARLRGRLTKRGVALSAGLLGAVVNSVTAGGPPEHLLRATLQAAATGNIPAAVAALVHGASPPMTLGKFKLAAAALLAVGLISGGLGLRMHATPPANADERRPAKTVRRTPSVKEAEAVRAADRDKAADADTKAVAVSGKVVGPDGKPVRAKLFVVDSEEWKAAPQAEADADGAFTFQLPPVTGQRWYRYVVATAPDLGLGCDWVGLDGTARSLTGVTLKLPKDVPIKGRLIDLEGKPVAGAKVRVTALETGKDDTLDEFVRQWSKDVGDQNTAIYSLEKRLAAKGALADYFAATTDAGGRFTLAGMGRDRCPRVNVSARGKAAQLCFVPLRPEFKPTLNGPIGTFAFGPEFTLTLGPSTPISGVVRDAQKKPVCGVRVVGQVDLNDAVLRGALYLPDVEAVTDAEGRYTLDGLPKGKKYFLLVSPKPGEGPVHQFASRRDDKPEITALTADFDLPRSLVLTGQIKDRKTGKPVRGYVFYRPLASNTWDDKYPADVTPGLTPWAGDTNAWTDAAGRFKLTAVPGPGVLYVQVFDGSYRAATLAPEDDTDEVMEKAGPPAGTFKVRGQGERFSPSSIKAYRVLHIPADAKTFTADMTVDPGDAPDPGGKSK